jgi:hypothetical protein
MMRTGVLWGIVSVWAVVGCTAGVDPGEEDTGLALGPLAPGYVAPTGRGAITRDQLPESPLGELGGDNGIQYHGGPVMLGTVNLYYIWYGNWSNNLTATSILSDFARNIGGSPYWNINTTYFDANLFHLSNRVAFKGDTTDPYSHGAALSDADVLAVVSDALTAGRLPTDANGIYFVLTSADVTETSGFCTRFCGFHDHASVHGVDIKYSFVGNPDRCPQACEAQQTSPNGNSGADGMASVIAHEAEEAATDPDLNAWFDFIGQENADKCAFRFGLTYTVANGSRANMRLGLRDYLIQENWVNAAGGYCSTHYP